uniref:Uncharacterized protein n=1 Tax=Romanomermis culicivorax TaxID=13658 RepID=A0A915KJY0_ROMCU
MTATMKNVNHGNVQRNFHPAPGHKALTTNLNPESFTPTALTGLQAETAPASCDRQAFGAMLISPAPTTPKIVSGSSDKILNPQISKISMVKPNLLHCRKPIFGSTLTISMANAIGDHAVEHHPTEV